MSNNSAGELALISWLRRKIGNRPRIFIDVGDDAACFKVGSEYVLITTDVLIDGVHFDSNVSSPYVIGRKAMAKNLSDIAAMGCYPTYAVATFALPKNTTMNYAKAIYNGLTGMGKRFSVEVIGGDITSHNGKLSISVALLGECRGLKPIRRSGAKIGDAIMVTGTFGGSILSKNMDFTPRVKEAIRLNKNFSINSMIDISDGLARDLSHICKESKVGAVIFEDAIPVSQDARKIAKRDKKTSLHHVLYDGEDYELLFTIPEREVDAVCRAMNVRRIGYIMKGQGILIQNSKGRTCKLKVSGYEHKFGR